MRESSSKSMQLCYCSLPATGWLNRSPAPMQSFASHEGIPCNVAHGPWATARGLHVGEARPPNGREQSPTRQRSRSGSRNAGSECSVAPRLLLQLGGGTGAPRTGRPVARAPRSVPPPLPDGASLCAQGRRRRARGRPNSLQQRAERRRLNSRSLAGPHQPHRTGRGALCAPSLPQRLTHSCCGAPLLRI